MTGGDKCSMVYPNVSSILVWMAGNLLYGDQVGFSLSDFFLWSLYLVPSAQQLDHLMVIWGSKITKAELAKPSSGLGLAQAPPTNSTFIEHLLYVKAVF